MLRKRSNSLLSALSLLILLSFTLLKSPEAAAQSAITRGTQTMLTSSGDGTFAVSASASAKISPLLSDSSGQVTVLVHLSNSPVAEVDDEPAQGAAVAAEQDAFIARINQIDSSARVLGRVKILLNAVMLEIDSAMLVDLAEDVRVITINPLVNFQLDLGETVPYIGATPEVQQSADGGAGVTVAVLDSGIDYTHAAFGGPGTLEAYQQAYGLDPADPRNTTLDDLFPTAKVVGGYDFVGEAWPNGPLAPDPDPIDYDGHGTHVADIIAGVTPAAPGVAPGASLYAVKVCSAVALSCSGAAIIQGMEYAVDPNGDGITTDHVDIINMSLGFAYGNGYFEDFSTAVENADSLGVLTVASAGNNGDRPYIVGAPSVAPSALSVAQTQAPSAKVYPLEIKSPPGIAGMHNNTSTLSWAPIGAGFTGDVVSAGTACSPDDLPPDISGKVALINRGDCNISAKVANASAAGASGVLIALTASGDAMTFPNDGDCPAVADGTCVPSLVITRDSANRINASLLSGPVNVSVSDANAIPLVGSVVRTSSRGPSSGEAFPENRVGWQYGQMIKPEIGAPGTSVSAIAGSGTGTAAFGGTSGSAPMVAGAAALLIANSWSITPPHEIKARLMNTAETEIYLNPATSPGTLAPITRIGNGEIRIDRALDTGAAAWEFLGAGGALSFGMVNVSGSQAKLYRMVEVKNYTRRPITYRIDSTFRYANDQENGAVTIRPMRRAITVPPYRSRYFLVEMQIDGTKLRPWTMNSGAGGGSSDALNTLEYDGYLTFTDRRNAKNNLHMAWHVLPRLSPDVRVSTTLPVDDTTAFTLKNNGVGGGTYYALPLLGENTTPPESGEQGSRNPNITARYVGAATYNTPLACSSRLLLQFGVQTWQPVTHANYPLEIGIYLDINRDGAYDSKIYTSEINGQTAFASDGRNATYAGMIGGTYTALFPTQHGTNSGTFVMTVCGEQVGLTFADAGRVIDVDFYTIDNYYGIDDASSIISTSMSILDQRYTVIDPTTGNSLSQISVAADSAASYAMYDAGDNGGSERGMLLLNTTGGKTESLVVKARRSTGQDPICRVGGNRWSHNCDLYDKRDRDHDHSRDIVGTQIEQMMSDVGTTER